MQFSRRTLIAGGARLAVGLPMFLAHGRSALGRPRDRGERVLVVLQLTGGNDGLNTVVPREQDPYYQLRPTLALGRGGLHGLDAAHGLHPALRGLGELFDAGRLACVHGVGYPDADRSHFRSMEVWHTGDPSGPARGIGWLGRLADQIAARHEGLLPAVHVGGGDLPLALRGEHSFAPTVRDASSFRLHGRAETIAAGRDALLERSNGGPELAFLRQAARATYAASERVTDLAAARSPVPYPGSPLSRQLNLVARLISGAFGARIYQVELGGFDTHVRQARTHAELLGVLSGALSAFQADLVHHGVARDVVTLVFSEFGRRVAENGSKGTDHGAGAPLFLIGDSVNAGMHGTPPDLEHLTEGDIAHTTDFRAIYACLEQEWLGLAPSSKVHPLPLVSS